MVTGLCQAFLWSLVLLQSFYPFLWEGLFSCLISIIDVPKVQWIHLSQAERVNNHLLLLLGAGHG